MANQKILQQGAEANIILSNNFIIKDRIPKSYRIKELDEKIRARRTRSEAKLLLKASSLIPCPAPFFQPSIKDSTKLKMPFIDGKKLSEYLDDFPLEKQKQICEQIGENIARLHDSDIIHGDLTTSNMILMPSAFETLAHSRSQINKTDDKGTHQTKVNTLKRDKSVSKVNLIEGSGRLQNFKIYFLDFGLGFISYKLEDKAVDLHLLHQALEAKHFIHWQSLFNSVIKGYLKVESENGVDRKKTLERLKAVEKRGRYKH